ncbi:CLK4-associating serine/arginine rich protein isoform X4 [Eulemur rufifrons]|uniref:CLK4-associating serine/arginine rich protein isoform X4 n=1 Tax=Eulemur rufifrons TaxID=859984 RepID=UPI0037442FD8
MWHEARKHERKLRGMMVDYKKRAERRREYYEKIKKDPAQFLQVHGRACKVHLDSAVALAAESPVNMMPWQGDTNNMIDRFDVRAHLDHIPDYTPPLLTTISPEQESDERKCNYERYRGLVQNDFAGISEEQCLYQIYIDELYGGLQRPSEDEKKKLAEKKASIGYTYEDSTVAEVEKVAEKPEEEESPAEEESNSDEDEVIPDIDVEVDVDELNQEQVADLNKQATTYGMADGDFVRMLRKDKEEAEAIKHAKALEEEKAMYSGRRSRRQRREFREKRLRGRKISPPSYARRDSPTYDPYKRSPSESSSESRSRSRSPTPGREEKITFITSFGGSDEEAAAAAAAAAASGATTGKPPAPPQPGGPAPGRNASARSVTLTLPALRPGHQGGDLGQRGAMAQARADWPSVPRLQPPLLLFLLLLFCLEDLQLPLQFPLQLPLPPRRGLLPLQPSCPLPVPLPLLVPLPLPLQTLFPVPQPWPAALSGGLPRRTPLLPLACPAWWLWAAAQKQEPLPLSGPLQAWRPGPQAPQQQPQPQQLPQPEPQPQSQPQPQPQPEPLAVTPKGEADQASSVPCCGREAEKDRTCRW